MPKPYSIDLRKRVAAFVEAGHSRRAAVAHFTVSPREPAHANHLPPGQPLVSVGYEREINGLVLADNHAAQSFSNAARAARDHRERSR